MFKNYNIVYSSRLCLIRKKLNIEQEKNSVKNYFALLPPPAHSLRNLSFHTLGCSNSPSLSIVSIDLIYYF